jgi:hypothetical protein
MLVQSGLNPSALKYMIAASGMSELAVLDASDKEIDLGQ